MLSSSSLFFQQHQHQEELVQRLKNFETEAFLLEVKNLRRVVDMLTTIVRKQNQDLQELQASISCLSLAQEELINTLDHGDRIIEEEQQEVLRHHVTNNKQQN
jgi:hypothetical protein